MDTKPPDGTEVFYRKNIREDLRKISLDADMIRLLLAVEENKSLAQIAAETKMEAATLQKNLDKLVGQGLIEPVEKNASILDMAFTRAVRLNLSRAIGPMAEILLEDILADLNLNPSRMTLDQAAELVNHLALEIPDEKTRLQFKRAMIPILNKATS
jgi:uncharacterized protein YhaN